jgi:catechol 2,3-dioxygenase
MSAPRITSIGHAALRVKDLEASVSDAVAVLGLHETDRVGQTVYMSHGHPHHSLQYIAAEEDALDHLAFEAAGDDALSAVRTSVERGGWQIVSDAPLDVGIKRGFAFVGPEGFVFEIYCGMVDARSVPRASQAPNRVGHFNLNPQDVEAMRDFFESVLGFQLSDAIASRNGYFLRCNVDHHGVALVPGRGSFHHHAWEAQSIADLAHLADLLDERGRHLLWGPVRHGAGHNVAAYYAEPCGGVVELYTDMERIYDPEFTPRTWDSDDHRWWNLWGTFRPTAFRELGVMPAPLTT